MKQWRYHDQARELDDSILADKQPEKVAEAREWESEDELELLRGLVNGDTAGRGVEDIKLAAEASVDQLLEEQKVRESLRSKLAAKSSLVDGFLETVKMIKYS